MPGHVMEWPADSSDWIGGSPLVDLSSVLQKKIILKMQSDRRCKKVLGGPQNTFRMAHRLVMD